LGTVGGGGVTDSPPTSLFNAFGQGPLGGGGGNFGVGGRAVGRDCVNPPPPVSRGTALNSPGTTRPTGFFGGGPGETRGGGGDGSPPGAGAGKRCWKCGGKGGGFFPPAMFGAAQKQQTKTNFSCFEIVYLCVSRESRAWGGGRGCSGGPPAHPPTRFLEFWRSWGGGGGDRGVGFVAGGKKNARGDGGGGGGGGGWGGEPHTSGAGGGGGGQKNKY